MKSFDGLTRSFFRPIAFALALLFCVSGHGWGLQQPAAPDTTHRSFQVEVTGHGRPMILIPGYASSGETWAGTVAHLEDHFACHVLTLAGFAGVPPIAGPLLPTVRDELASYIRRNHLDHPVIVGHSLGGTLALDLAARYPDLTGPLVIVDALPFMAGPSFQSADLNDAKPKVAAMHAYMAAETREQYEQGVRSEAGFKYMVTQPADLERLKRWGLATDPATAAEAMLELYSLDLRPDLARISTPVLVLGTWIGLKEQLKAYRLDLKREDFINTFQTQYTNLPALHFAMADSARHFIMFDDPAWFYRQLDAFLADPAAAARDRGFGNAGAQRQAGGAAKN